MELLGELNEIIYIKHLAKSLANDKYLIRADIKTYT